MTENDILDAIGDIDPAYLEEINTKSETKKIRWWKAGSLAACLLMILIVPICFQHNWLVYESVDYVATDYEECNIYYVKDQALYYESAGVRGGDGEMFEVWKSKNGIAEEAALQNIVFSTGQDGIEDTVIMTLPAALSCYFENEDGAWRREALKKTLASYRKITINTIELIFV